jgi:hypothetical protein
MEGRLMEWALDLTLIVLLAATLFHALRLERALGVLKRDRGALEELVGAFNASTQMAEQGIDRLRKSADGAGRQITLQIDLANGLKNDLIFLTERGERLADRMETLIRSGRRADATVPAAHAPLTLVTQAQQTELSEDAPVRLRSQAERDLLKALKQAR